MGRRKQTKPVLKEVQNKIRPEFKYRVYYLGSGGTRTSSVFKSKSEASNFYEIKLAESENLGSEVSSVISDKVKREVFEAMRRLEPYGKTISEAVEHYVQHLEATEQSRPIDELIDMFLEEMRRAGKSDRYMIDLSHRLVKFKADKGKRFASDITTREAQTWLNRLKVSDLTRNNYRRVLSAFFAWCERQSFVQTNPISKTTKTKVVGGEIEVFTIDEIKTVLKLAARSDARDLLATVCIGAFAGLRASEIERLTWEDVKIDRGIIDLKKSKTKTAARRLVEIRPILREWLAEFKNETGAIQKKGFDRRLRAFRRKLEEGNSKSGRKPVSWPHNGLRHSFASYLLAEIKDPGAVSLQLGHNNAGVLFQHYRELITEEDAALYWSALTPQKLKPKK
ncbi:tyrosine-type recombinase/integrase [Coraliomargarita sp. W4R72]